MALSNVSVLKYSELAKPPPHPAAVFPETVQLLMVNEAPLSTAPPEPAVAVFPENVQLLNVPVPCA